MSYLNENVGVTFCHFTAEARRQELMTIFSSVKFFSILMNGTTDKGNIDHLCLVLHCDTTSSDEKVHTWISYLTVARPQTVIAEGFFEWLQSGLRQLGIEATDAAAGDCKKIVELELMGAAANIFSGGFKGLVERKLHWVFWTWCLAHRLELAVKDVLKGTAFNITDDMLLRLYHIYK